MRRAAAQESADAVFERMRLYANALEWPCQEAGVLNCWRDGGWT